MKSIIPYSKEISFGSKIAEITSMSLEHDLNIESGCASGNFIISGDYKSHEVSVNREPFLYKLPFSIELTDHIDLDSIRFEIRDFSYDIVNDETIEVDIEFSLEAEELAMEEIIDEGITEEEAITEEVERGLLEKVEDPVVETDLTHLIDENLTFVKEESQEEIDSFEEPREVDVEEEKDLLEEKVEDARESEITMVAQKVEDMKQSEETIIQNVNPMDDSYATYHIHIVKDGENVETICTMYHSNLNLLSEYNDMSNVSVGSKIIVPKEDE